MTETPNLHLKKADLTEPADIRIYNEDMDFIDAEAAAVRIQLNPTSNKDSPSTGDKLLLADSADGGRKKWLLWSALLAAVKKLFYTKDENDAKLLNKATGNPSTGDALNAEKLSGQAPGYYAVKTTVDAALANKADTTTVNAALLNKVNIVEVVNDVDCHTLKTPKDYIIINTDKTVAGNVALRYPPETGHWGLTIKATLYVSGVNGKLYIATNRDSGNVWKKLEVSDKFGEWKQLATTTPPQVFPLPLVSGVTKYEGAAVCWVTQQNEAKFVAHITSNNKTYNNRHIATLPDSIRPKRRYMYQATGISGAAAVGGYIRVMGADTPETAGNIYLTLAGTDAGSVYINGEFVIGE